MGIKGPAGEASAAAGPAGQRRAGGLIYNTIK